MRILAIGFVGAKFFEKNLKEEIESRGHSMDACSAEVVNAEVGLDGVVVRAGDLNLADYDVIHVGAIAKNRWPVIAMLGYLHRTTGCQVIDSKIIESKLDEYSCLTNYFLEHEHGLHLPRSIVFKYVNEIEDKLHEFEFPVIIKTTESKQGQGVGLAKNVKGVRDFVKARLAKDEDIGFVLRERIPNNGDYRVNVIDGRAVVCLKRTPKRGEFRSNIALGGKLSNERLEDFPEVCAAAEKISQLSNYDIAGVDVMVHQVTGVPYILEVNRAPSGLEDDVAISGVDLARLIVDLYEKRVRTGKGGILARFIKKLTG